jgi:hypothetical protein
MEEALQALKCPKIVKIELMDRQIFLDTSKAHLKQYRVDWDPIYADIGNEITWECDNPFSIHFGNESLMDQILYCSKKKEGTDRYEVKASVSKDAFNVGRKFVKYTVAVYHKEDEKIYMVDPGMGVPEDPPDPPVW